MLAVVYVVLTFVAGLALVQKVFPRMPPLVRLAGGYLVGVALTSWLVFLVAWGFSPFTKESLLIGIWVAVVAQVGVIVAWGRELRARDFPLKGGELLAIAAAVLYSAWLMDARLSGDPLTVSLNAWGDTTYHIAILRSFSWGSNYPPEFPLFGGEIMRYHFGPDFYAGSLERAGLGVQWALNLPGLLAFAAMMLVVFEMGRLLFRHPAVGVMAVVLLIANSSLAFLRYFELHDNSITQAVSNLWDHNRYLAIGPYSVTGDPPDKISMFWTPNIWLTQTQLILGMASMLWVAYGVLQPLKERRPFWTREALVLGGIMGTLFWVNGVLFIPAVIFMMALLLVFGRWREAVPFVALAGIFSLAQAIWLNGGNVGTGGSVSIHVGYLVDGFRLTSLSSWWDFLEYWWLNLGLTLPLLILGAVLAAKTERKVLLAVMAIFVFGNFIALGRDIGGHNHKVFNLWLILVNFFAAFAFVSFWNLFRDNVKLGNFSIQSLELNYSLRALIPVVFLLLVLSGIIDAMVLKNDYRFVILGDREPVIEWIDENTPRDSMFLSTYGIYTTSAPAGRMTFWGGFEPLAAGRKAFWGGFERWTSDKGYDVEARRQLIHAIYGEQSRDEACRLLTENGIDYVQIGPGERISDRFPINFGLFEREFEPAYVGDLSDGRMVFYDVGRSCPSASAVAR